MRQRLYVVAVLGALALVAGVGVAVLRSADGSPSPASLAKTPNPAIPGKVAYFDNDGCIATVNASGAGATQLYCLATAPFGPATGIAWLDAGTIGFLDASPSRPVITGSAQFELVRLDVASRKVQRTGQLYPADKVYGGAGPAATAPNGDGLTTDNRGQVFVIHEGVRTRIADFDAPEYRGPQPLAWSPDSNWMLLSYFPRNADNRTEIWVLSRDGQTRGTLVTNAGNPGRAAAWWIDGAGGWPALPPP